MLDDETPSPEELRAAEELRESLADPSRQNDDADFLRAVHNAVKPAPLEKSENARLVATAIARAPKRRGVVIRVAFGATALALAASIAFFLRTQERTAPPSYVSVRSTQELFDKPFERGQTSARIDRIATSRSSDLRENHYTKWGVK